MTSYSGGFVIAAIFQMKPSTRENLMISNCWQEHQKWSQFLFRSVKSDTACLAWDSVIWLSPAFLSDFAATFWMNQPIVCWMYYLVSEILIYACIFIIPQHWDYACSWCSFPMGLLPDTENCELRMRRECRERFPRHPLQRKPLVSDPGMHHARAVMHVGITNPRWRGKRSRHFRRMHNPQFIVSGKRPIETEARVSCQANRMATEGLVAL